MSHRNTFLKGGAILSLTQMVGQICSLGRNIIIARIVSPADFGIAAIFVMVVMFLQMMSNLAMDRLLVQAIDGDNPRFQQVAHFLQALRGIIISVVILISAGFLSSIFSLPELKDTFRVLALLPLLNGFCHLDPKRMEREMRFWPGASVELVSQLLVLLLAWPVAKWFGDYRAMLVILLVKQVVFLVGTQLVAERDYRWARDETYIRRFLAFGGPLLVNGMLMFVILQGDRFIMGAAKKMFGTGYDMSSVGLYSAALMLTMIPTTMASKISSTLFLPILSNARGVKNVFIEKARFLGEAVTALACIILGILLLAGDKLLPYVYGEQYRMAGALMGWLSILWAFRLIRIVPASIAMSMGKTTNLMNANFVRFSFLIGVIFVVAKDLDIVWVAIVGVLGEISAYISALILNNNLLGIPYRLVHQRSDSVFVSSLVFAIVLKLFILNGDNGGRLSYVFFVILIYVLFVMWFFKGFIKIQMKSYLLRDG